MEEYLILIVSFVVLVIAGYSAKIVFGGMRKQRSLNKEFLKRRGFNEVPEQKELLKEIIAVRDIHIVLGRLVPLSSRRFKVVDCYKTTDRGKELYFLTTSGFAQPKSMIDGVYILAPLQNRKKDPFYVSLWSNTFGPGTWVYRSKKRISAMDFGKIAAMNGRDIYRSDDLPDFEQVDFYGPAKEHPVNYLGDTLLEMVRYGRENGIAEISCLDGVALFRIYSLTGTQQPGNVLTDPEKPYRFLLGYL
jgi:hypothetical protein